MRTPPKKAGMVLPIKKNIVAVIITIAHMAMKMITGRERLIFPWEIGRAHV